MTYMTRCALALTIALHAVAPLPAAAQSTPETVQTDQSIAVEDNAASDAQIRTRIQQLLRQIEGYNEVTITVSGGVVTLRGEVLDTIRRDELVAIVNRVTGVVTIKNETAVSTDLEERLAPALERMIERGQIILANAPIYLLAFTVFLLIAWAGWKLTPRLRLWDWIAPNRFIADIYRAVARIVFVLLGVVVALDILNLTALLGAVLGAAGVVGLALGFAVRDTVENFIASILLSLRQPFRPNDFVDISGDLGSVARLTSRATILISPDGNLIRIPNATVYKGRIINYTRDPNRRFTFDLGVDADADLSGALATAADAISSLPFVLRDPPVSAWISEVGDSNVILSFAAWLDQRNADFLKGRGEAIRIAKEALEAAGYGLPEPIYRLRVDGSKQASALANAVLSETDAAAPPEKAPAPEPQSSGPTEVHEASDPTRSTDSAKDVVNRERATAAAAAGEDLLDDRNPTE